MLHGHRRQADRQAGMSSGTQYNKFLSIDGKNSVLVTEGKERKKDLNILRCPVVILKGFQVTVNVSLCV